MVTRVVDHPLLLLQCDDTLVFFGMEFVIPFLQHIIGIVLRNRFADVSGNRGLYPIGIPS